MGWMRLPFNSSEGSWALFFNHELNAVIFFFLFTRWYSRQTKNLPPAYSVDKRSANTGKGKIPRKTVRGKDDNLTAAAQTMPTKKEKRVFRSRKQKTFNRLLLLGASEASILSELFIKLRRFESGWMHCSKRRSRLVRGVEVALFEA